MEQTRRAKVHPACPLGIPMWPHVCSELFPPPTEAWLQTVSSDPEAQGWGAWDRTEKTSLVPRAGGTAGSDKEAEENEDAGFLLSLLEPENLAKSPVYNQVAPRHKLWRKVWTWARSEGHS